MSPPSVRLGAITGTLMGIVGVRGPPAGTYSSGPGTARRPVWIIQSLAKRLLMAVQNPPHPGGIVKRQGLEPLELTVTRAAKGDRHLSPSAIGPHQRPRRDLSRDGGPAVGDLRLDARDLAGHADGLRSAAGPRPGRGNRGGVTEFPGAVTHVVPSPRPSQGAAISRTVYAVAHHLRVSHECARDGACRRLPEIDERDRVPLQHLESSGEGVARGLDPRESLSGPVAW